MRKKSGQNVLEYSILLIIIIAAFLTMQNYVKRGFQGRWKTTVDDLGEQYDPRTANSQVTHTISSVSNTVLNLIDARVDGLNGFFTLRTDQSSSEETRSGLIEVGN